MQFEHGTHSETHDQIAEYLRELFDDPYHDEENGHFYVRYGSTVLEISVDAYGPEESVITIMAYCVQGAQVDEDLLVGLLDLNHRMPFGAFSVVDKDIFFSHAIFGRSLQPSTLLGAVAAVATVSDDYDDQIVAKYGGQTALDRIQDTGGFRRRVGDRGRPEIDQPPS